MNDNPSEVSPSGIELGPDAGWLGPRLRRLSFELSPCANCDGHHSLSGRGLPGQKAIVDVLERFIGILFPGCHGHASDIGEGDPARMTAALAKAATRLRDLSVMVLSYDGDCENCEGRSSAAPADLAQCRERANAIVASLLDALPGIRAMLQEDIVAGYEGDPAARSTMEVVLSYPGLYAVVVHRLAHALCKAGLPMIPRVMSEHAHSRTGIDIHPGATIGPGFFIDHGTGVVIGETCEIGRHVKLYQGVTLGALSFERDANGNLIKGIKRHPDVEDNVVIYAGATILGGRTRIGHDSVVGANVWLVHSVPPHSKVYNQEPAPEIRTRNSQP